MTSMTNRNPATGHRTVVRYLPSGLIDVDQLPVGGFPISFNPDDDRFYVHDKDDDASTLATFAELRNARQYASRRAIKEAA